jgi:hypothetical protein
MGEPRGRQLFRLVENITRDPNYSGTWHFSTETLDLLRGVVRGTDTNHSLSLFGGLIYSAVSSVEW